MQRPQRRSAERNCDVELELCQHKDEPVAQVLETTRTCVEVVQLACAPFCRPSQCPQAERRKPRSDARPCQTHVAEGHRRTGWVLGVAIAYVPVLAFLIMASATVTNLSFASAKRL